MDKTAKKLGCKVQDKISKKTAQWQAAQRQAAASV